MNKLFLLITLLLIGCSKEEIVSPQLYETHIYEENGIIKAKETAIVGEWYYLNEYQVGDKYLVVDNDLLRNVVRNDNYEFVVTTRVTDMNHLFYPGNGNPRKYTKYKISYWDVSNVTDMSYMLYNAGCWPGSLTNWDVSKVTSCYNFHNEVQGQNACTLPESWYPNFTNCKI